MEKNKIDFRLLLPGEQEKIYLLKYNATQIKCMCRHYKQRLTGNKVILAKRLYHYLKTTNCSNIIKLFFKRFLLKKYIEAKGPGFIRRAKCVNDCDFFTMTPTKDIPIEQFISFKDVDGTIYGFDILSVHSLFTKCKSPYKNPYNRNSLPTYLYENVKIIYRLSPLFFDKATIQVDEIPLNETKIMEFKLLNIFQEINNLGNYADHDWLWSLNRVGLVKFIRELADIWCYRANLTNETKQKICPPHGDPFLGTCLRTLSYMEWNVLREKSIHIIQSIVMASSDHSNRCLGANYVLCALTLVNETAALSLPWLYQSVAHY